MFHGNRNKSYMCVYCTVCVKLYPNKVALEILSSLNKFWSHGITVTSDSKFMINGDFTRVKYLYNAIQLKNLDDNVNLEEKTFNYNLL